MAGKSFEAIGAEASEMGTAHSELQGRLDKANEKIIGSAGRYALAQLAYDSNREARQTLQLQGGGTSQESTGLTIAAGNIKDELDAARVASINDKNNAHRLKMDSAGVEAQRTEHFTSNDGVYREMAIRDATVAGKTVNYGGETYEPAKTAA